MPRSVYRKINGEWRWIEYDEKGNAKEPIAPFIHQDTMDPLTHPVTGEVIDSRCQWERINERHGLECVGNELLSEKPRRCEEKVTDAVVMDRIYRAEAIFDDPSKRRAREYENLERRARVERLINGSR